jgi:integrase
VLGVLSHVDGWARTAALLLYATGARLGEVSGLLWRDVDLADGWVSVSGKTGPHDVPLTPEVVDVLRRLPGRDPDATVCGVRATHVWNNLSRRLLDACKAVGVQPFTPQGLRRFAVDEMARSGVDIGAACAVTGHSPRVMLTYYRTATTDDRRRAVAAARLGSLRAGKVLPFQGRTAHADDD